MEMPEKIKTSKKSIMVLGTSSGVGKSITVTAICRILKEMGEQPIPFKGQNMSNNAWVDSRGGEMAYSQALQAFASGISPNAEMNPILLKPQGNSISEIIHLGKSVGTSTAKNYYQEWYDPGWAAIRKGIKVIFEDNQDCRLIVEGAGSPVEMNLIHRDLTNLKIAKYLNANCILVADIEKGGVFAQIIGTLELLTSEERNLIKGIIINKFRGDLTLFNEGKKWIENKTKIPILGIMPSLEDKFPPEDSLDILERKILPQNPDIEIGIIKLPSISNFSDLDPLENESWIRLNWINHAKNLNKFDLLIIPGSKQTIKDLLFLKENGLLKKIQEYSKTGGHIIGICGGMQMLGRYLKDPYHKEGSEREETNGLDILPLKTIFLKKKITTQISCKSLWPCKTKLDGFEIHNGITDLVQNNQYKKINPIFENERLGWYFINNNKGSITGTYLHGIFENDAWKNSYFNEIRVKKGLKLLDKKLISYKIKKDAIINNLATQFKNHINITSLLN